jgi:diguanylate cyclase (GGDEF)-like protein
MNITQSIFSDFYALIVLAILLLIVLERKDYYTARQKRFLRLIVGTMYLLINDSLIFLLEGTLGRVITYALYFLNISLFLVTAILVMWWGVYVHETLMQARTKKNKLYYWLIPLFVSIALVVNFIVPVVFRISDVNEYQREIGTYVIMLLDFLIGFYLIYLTIRRLKYLSSDVKYGILSLLFFPLLGGILQMFHYGIASLFSSFALGLLAGYILIENLAVNTDHLTGLFSRVKSYQYMQDMMRRKHPFSLAILDLDNLKWINDRFGHEVGDKVISCFAHMLQHSFSMASMIARSGGDEFMVVTQIVNRKSLEHVLQDLAKHLECDELDFPILFSYGYSIWKGGEKTIDELMREADMNMYHYKKYNKRLRRRSTDVI